MVYFSRNEKINKNLVFSNKYYSLYFIIFEFVTIIGIRWLIISESVLIIIILIGYTVTCVINIVKINLKKK